MDSFGKENGQDDKLYHKILNITNQSEQFAAVNNILVTKLDVDYAEGELTVTKNSLNPHGIVHGGCLATLADTVAGAAVASRLRACVTLNYAMNFLAPARGTRIKCVATPQKVGKTVCIFHCELTDDQEKTVATGDFTFIVVDKDRFKNIKLN